MMLNELKSSPRMNLVTLCLKTSPPCDDVVNQGCCGITLPPSVSIYIASVSARYHYRRDRNKSFFFFFFLNEHLTESARHNKQNVLVNTKMKHRTCRLFFHVADHGEWSCQAATCWHSIRNANRQQRMLVL